jgi:transcriptional regulator with XRE-family HTH domain
MFLEKRERAIKAALKIRGLNQKDVAQELKMTPSYITRLINGTRYSRKFENWIKLVLHIDYTWL